MAEMINLVAPDAPMPAEGEPTRKPRIGQRSIRFGLLDNCKANADHLLAFLVAGVQRVFPLASVVSLRKDNAAKGAPGQILDKLAAQTDFVVSAMAD